MQGHASVHLTLSIGTIYESLEQNPRPSPSERKVLVLCDPKDPPRYQAEERHKKSLPQKSQQLSFIILVKIKNLGLVAQFGQRWDSNQSFLFARRELQIPTRKRNISSSCVSETQWQLPLHVKLNWGVFRKCVHNV